MTDGLKRHTFYRTRKSDSLKNFQLLFLTKRRNKSPRNPSSFLDSGFTLSNPFLFSFSCTTTYQGFQSDFFPPFLLPLPIVPNKSFSSVFPIRDNQESGFFTPRMTKKRIPPLNRRVFPSPLQASQTLELCQRPEEEEERGGGGGRSGIPRTPSQPSPKKQLEGVFLSAKGGVQ